MFVKLPMIDAVNKAFGGEVVRGLMTEFTNPAELNFSRNSAPFDLLTHSFTTVVNMLGGLGIALPLEFKAEADDRLAQLAVGHGFMKGNTFLNPNPAGFVLVTSQRGLVLSTTWADAPAFVCVYTDPSNPNVRVIAAGSGIWHILPKGTIRQTVELIRKEVERLLRVNETNGEFDIRNLWVQTSPGAGADGDWPFRLDRKGEVMLSQGDTADFVGRFVKPLDDPTPEPWRGDKPLRDRVLDLAGLVGGEDGLWEAEGLVMRDESYPAGQLFFDPRPNGEVSHANKRAANAAGQTTWSSEIVAISLV